MFTTNEVSGSVTISNGYGTAIKVTQSGILRVMQRTTDEVFLGDGLKLNIVYDEEMEYCFREFKRDMSVKNSICLTHDEWLKLLSYAADISPPPVIDEICCLCSDYIPHEIHYGCVFNVIKMDLFVLTDFGNAVIDALMKATLDRYTSVMIDSVGFGIDYNKLKRAYAYIKKGDVLSIMGIDTEVMIQNGPTAFNNENILKFEQHFRNFKVCAKDIILIKIEEHFVE